MRTLIRSTRATVGRTQERLDQQYIIDVARNIMGELQITQEDFENHPDVRDFCGFIFPGVLHRISEMNAGTLGKIAVYGLGKGETSKDIPLRTTTLKDAWYGTPLELDLNGGVGLEWLATATVVGAIHDLFQVHALVDDLKAKARTGGRDGCPIKKLFATPDWLHR